MENRKVKIVDSTGERDELVMLEGDRLVIETDDELSDMAVNQIMDSVKIWMENPDKPLLLKGARLKVVRMEDYNDM